MAHELLASVRINLPDEPSAMARQIGEIAAAWADFLDRVPHDADRDRDLAFSINETRTPRAKPAASNGTGAKRGRKPRATPPAEMPDGPPL